MTATVAPDLKPDHSEEQEGPTVDLVPAHTRREDHDARSFDPTQGRQIGSSPYDDPTQGQIGSNPYDDPTQGRQIGSNPYDDPTQGQQIGSNPYEDPTQAR